MQMQIERAVLSSILFDSERLDTLAELLAPEDFSYAPHKNIFFAMLELHRTDRPIDEEFILKLSTKARPIPQEELLNVLTTSPIGNVKAYADEIRNASIKRKLHSFATKIQESTSDENSNTQEIMDYLQSELYKITNVQQSRDFRSAKEISEATMEYINKMKARGNHLLIGVDTGFTSLNKITTGFGNGDLIIVAARPAMGKTTLVLNMSQKALDTGRGVAFFSLEMPAEQLMLRMLAAKTSIALQDLRVGNLQDDEWRNLSYAVDVMSKAPLFIDDNSILTIHQLRTKLRKIKSKHPEIGLAVVDYLQLMSGASNRDRHQEVSEISRGLKMIARELEIPIIALSQLNRSLESRSDRRPMLSDLRESGSIEQDADIILFVYRDAVYKLKDEKEKEEAFKKEGKEYKSTFVFKNEEEAEIIIGKQRNGPTGMVKLVFQKHCTRFIDTSDSMSALQITFENAETTQTKFIPPQDDGQGDKIEVPFI
ncbi:replicative DNA helicase [Helicobacter sp.]|uniref:replicative DNA helicase n=1 Tax=Helicobacter sp. TaxID=218 RepID=UPI0025C0BCB0|nr:replicative DNA helicase [Helicobacter sp.]MCI5968836.1 replicative DNA helicase [Helicobacter sp.]MDY2585021.1 replicative DNA helicase [Helicobacter sp.]